MLSLRRTTGLGSLMPYIVALILLGLVSVAGAQGDDEPDENDGNNGGGWRPPIAIDGSLSNPVLRSYTEELLGSVVMPPREIGNFTLPSTTGEDFSFGQVRGEILMVYFGYLTCPDVCPMTMVDMRRAYLEAGAPQNVQGIFITLDPERDTLELMTRYVQAFDPSFIGLRPDDAEQLAELAAAFGVVYERRDVDSSLEYLIDHSATVFMVGMDGRMVSQYPYGLSYTEMGNDLEVLTRYSLAADGERMALAPRPPSEREYRIVIPEGTGALIKQGQDPGIIPLTIELILGEQDILVIENHDGDDYLVGGLWVAPYETVSKQFYETQTFVGLCTITVGADLIEIIVREPEPIP